MIKIRAIPGYLKPNLRPISAHDGPGSRYDKKTPGRVTNTERGVAGKSRTADRAGSVHSEQFLKKCYNFHRYRTKMQYVKRPRLVHAEALHGVDPVLISHCIPNLATGQSSTLPSAASHSLLLSFRLRYTRLYITFGKLYYIFG